MRDQCRTFFTLSHLKKEGRIINKGMMGLFKEKEVQLSMNNEKKLEVDAPSST